MEIRDEKNSHTWKFNFCLSFLCFRVQLVLIKHFFLYPTTHFHFLSLIDTWSSIKKSSWLMCPLCSQWKATNLELYVLIFCKRTKIRQDNHFMLTKKRQGRERTRLHEFGAHNWCHINFKVVNLKIPCANKLLATNKIF